MPECQNCGGHVSKRYARVFTPTGADTPRVCPSCPDMTRAGGDIREKKS